MTGVQTCALPISGQNDRLAIVGLQVVALFQFVEQVDHVAFGVVDAPRPVRVPGDVFLYILSLIVDFMVAGKMSMSAEEFVTALKLFQQRMVLKIETATQTYASTKKKLWKESSSDWRLRKYIYPVPAWIAAHARRKS